MKILEKLEPKKVFEYFEEISSIPRGSGNTKKILEYCENFALKKGLRSISDKAGNIIIFKAASLGRENEPPVIIQGHLDMVCEKEESCEIDFETDGLELFVSGDLVGAKGTTLGGDDGIAVAMCLALLDGENYSHPPLEIVFTSDEETGMDGANAIDVSLLCGKRMINVDSEAEGTLWVSCAGGARVDISLDISRTEKCSSAYLIKVCGLHGGHSGAEIHNGYLNANKVIGSVLKALQNEMAFSLTDIYGGTMDNAITRECCAEVFCDCDKIANAVCEISKKISETCAKTDPEIKITVEKIQTDKKIISQSSSEKIISLLNELPSGVISMSDKIEGLVETSLNLGILKTENDKTVFSFSVRSGKDGERTRLTENLKESALRFGCSFAVHGEYPAWEYNPNSALSKTMAKVYKDMFGKEMKVTAIHAGLECGIFSGKIKGLDCVSFGPDMFDIHTPNERLSISSVERSWRYLLCVLEKI